MTFRAEMLKPAIVVKPASDAYPTFIDCPVEHFKIAALQRSDSMAFLA